MQRPSDLGGSANRGSIFKSTIFLNKLDQTLFFPCLFGKRYRNFSLGMNRQKNIYYLWHQEGEGGDQDHGSCTNSCGHVPGEGVCHDVHGQLADGDSDFFSTEQQTTNSWHTNLCNEDCRDRAQGSVNEARDHSAQVEEREVRSEGLHKPWNSCWEKDYKEKYPRPQRLHAWPSGESREMPAMPGKNWTRDGYTEGN